MTVSYNCANQAGPGAQAFNTGGQMMLSPVSEGGFLITISPYNSTSPNALEVDYADGQITILKKASFGFQTTDFPILEPVTLTNNLTCLPAGGNIFLPVQPTVGDTFRIIDADSRTTIHMADNTQVAYLVNSQTSLGGTITGTGVNGGNNITIVCCFSSIALVEYVCYDVMGPWVFA